MLKRSVVLLGLLAAVGGAVFVARAGRGLSARIDEIFGDRNRRDAPGCSVGISRNGVPVHERGYGMANLELDVPITPASVFEAASISKQFTAMIGKADTAVEPLAADMFTTVGDFMKFSRDSNGAINGLTVVSTGARGLRFERVQ